MPKSDLLTRLSQKPTKPDKVAEEVMQDFALLPEIVEGLDSETAVVQFRCAKILRIVAEQHPDQLYKYWDKFVELLDSDNKIMKWEGIIVLAYLTAVDEKDKFADIFDDYYDMIDDPVMITAANVIGHSGVIVNNKPQYADRVTELLLSVEQDDRESKECLNIMLGKAIIAFDEFFSYVPDPDKVVEFVQRQLENKRRATKIKAEKFLKQHASE